MTAADEHALEVGPRIKKARKAAQQARRDRRGARNLGIQTSRGGFKWQPTSVRNTERRFDESTGGKNEQ